MNDADNKNGMTPEKALDTFNKDDEIVKLKRIRVSKGLSQQGLADKSGVNKRLILSYEQRERNIDGGGLDKLCNLCIALGVKIEDLIEDEELRKKYMQCK